MGQRELDLATPAGSLLTNAPVLSILALLASALSKCAPSLLLNHLNPLPRLSPLRLLSLSHLPSPSLPAHPSRTSQPFRFIVEPKVKYAIYICFILRSGSYLNFHYVRFF